MSDRGGSLTRAAARTGGELSITAGLLVLLFVAWQLWWTDVGAGRAEAAAASHLAARWAAAPAPPAAAPAPSAALPAPASPAPVSPAPASPAPASPAPAPSPSPAGVPDPPVPAEPAHAQAFAIVHVPRFGAGWQVAAEQGVDTEGVLDDGVLGHYPGTAMVGAVGDFAMAGHRVTYGKPLNQIAELRAGDPIVVETGDAWYVYRVTGHEVVTPDRVDVIAPVPGQPDAVPTERILTLTACHPQFSARYRYVVHAVMESWQPRSAGEPSALRDADPAAAAVPAGGA